MHNFTKLKFPTDKPWLIIGKGPSFEKLPQNYNKTYYTLGLNHVFQRVSVDLGLFIDLDVLIGMTDCLATSLLCPIFPHVNFVPTKHRIDFIAKANPMVEYISDKLYYFSHSKKPCEFPTIPVRFSSSEAAFAILGYMGVKEIHSIGLDGGKEYAETFQDLKPLTNGQADFNKQFKAIEVTLDRYNIRYKAL